MNYGKLVFFLVKIRYANLIKLKKIVYGEFILTLETVKANSDSNTSSLRLYYVIEIKRLQQN